MPRAPRLVELSVRFYRLLLAAYPLSFRREYGEPMAQLFRDAALDAYRQRGLAGLLRVWVDVIADFALSVLRQQWEEVMVESESLSLRYVLHRWIFLGCTLLSVVLLSIRYTLYLIPRRPLSCCITLSLVALAVCLSSCHKSIGKFDLPLIGARFLLPDDIHLRITNGVLECSRTHAVEPPMPEERWRTERAHRSRLPPAPKVWALSFSWHEIGQVRAAGMITHVQYWLLRFPLWVIPAVLLLPWAIAAVRRFFRRFRTIPRRASLCCS